MSTTAPQQANGQPAAEQIRLPGAPPPPEAPKSHQLRTAIIGAICALALAGLAVAAILLVSNHATVVRGPSPSQAYQTRLSAVLTPIVASNRTLSSAVQAIDGSRSTLRVASDATKAAQQQVVAVRGAMTVIVVPAADQQLSQQATQALTQEAGYLAVLGTTLGDPTSSASASLQPLASATSSAFVPLASVAPGGSVSISGVDNLQAWVSGANAARRAKAARAAQARTNTTIIQPTIQTPPPVVVPSTDASLHTVADTVGNPTITAGSSVSDGFARNVLIAAATYYQSNGALPDGVSLSVSSPDTGSTYSVSYSYDGSTITAYNMTAADGGGTTADLISFPGSDANGTGSNG
jgi:hypothetical protein